MFALIKWSRTPMSLIAILLLYTMIGPGYTDDLDGSGVGWFPGPGGGGGGGSKDHDVEVYLDKDMMRLQTNIPFEVVSGLAITSTQGKVVTRQFLPNSGQILKWTPNPKVTLEPQAKDSATVREYAENLVVQGDYIVGLKVKELMQDMVNLTLQGDTGTHGALTLIRIAVKDEVSMDRFEEWMLNANGGALIALPGNGTLSVSGLLKAAFYKNIEIKQVGILQIEFDKAGNIVNKTAMLAERTISDVEVQVESSKP
jgi:hypothetical protein